ncbi:PfkB family carbohydrate kinase [Goodfellowiella coeruleoviolacea]|uniref:PfkB family carbohydrate kinase n=1 Tax=Goodfellowiella coeruleoviolacea TaxID=334858 RepID=UPI0020A5EAE4|nr:PfkB family carbohydrate kinase [Goodfellowiella coeruleoviolacea]
MVLAGLCTVDLVQRVAELPGPGGKTQSTGMAVAAGGPASNAAVTVAALGGHARLLTVLGRHPLAELARADLTRHRVEVVDVLPERADPPPVSAVAVRERDGERSVVSPNAAGVDLPAPVLAGLADQLAGADAVLLDGHHPALAVAVASAARALGVPVVLDAGSWKPVLTELLPLVDVCACAEGFRLPEHPDGPATEAALHRIGIPVVTRTGGPAPVRWSCRRPGPTGAELVSGCCPVPAVTARDTLGAGDVWHGALVHGVARRRGVPGPGVLPELVRAANQVAAVRVRRIGPRAWLADLPARP